MSNGTYEANPSDNESTFITVAYPYPSGGMHIGHARTYTVTVIASGSDKLIRLHGLVLYI